MAGRNVFRFEGILSHDGIDEKSKRTSDDPAEKRDLYCHGGATGNISGSPKSLGVILMGP